MFHKQSFAKSSIGRGPLQKILLDYLQEAESVAAWPGADGLTTEDILDFYPKAVAQGEVPEWQELLNRHPGITTELHNWLADKDRWGFAFRRRTEATERACKPVCASSGNSFYWDKAARTLVAQCQFGFVC
jgi:hypothetical protein